MPFGGLPTRWEPEGPPRGLALVLPGRAYAPSAPLLDLARRALLQHDWTVQEVWWNLADREPGEDADAFVRRHMEEAVRQEPVSLVVGKSLGTRASAYAAERGLDSVWLTPLLVEESQVTAIRANPARQLLVGGSDDPFWHAQAAVGLESERCRVVQLDGADHALGCTDAVRTAQLHVDAVTAVAGFLRSL